MSCAGTGVRPDVRGICIGREKCIHVCRIWCVARSLEGFSLDPQSKWISKTVLVWAHASFMCYIWPHPSSQVLKKMIAPASGQCSLAHVVGRKLKWGQRSISETHRGVESLTTFLQVFWILLSVGASSPNRQVSSCWDKPQHKLEPGLMSTIDCPLSSDLVPRIVLSMLSFNPYNNPIWGRCYYYPHFTDGETEVPSSTAGYLQSRNSNPEQSGSSCHYSW